MAKNKRVSSFIKNNKILTTVSVIIFLIVVIIGFITLRTMYLKSIAASEIEKNINTIQLAGKIVHHSIRDDGCAAYTQGLFLGNKTRCSFSGEKMYIDNQDLVKNIHAAVSELNEKGFSTKSDIDRELDLFRSEKNREIAILFYNEKTHTNLRLEALNKSSDYASFTPETTVIINNLKQRLTDDEYIYGLSSDFTYKAAEERIPYLPQF